MKILSVLGARPQFIKAAPVSRALRETEHKEIMVHTGQHYDYKMSRIFFDELSISEPHVNLEVGSGPHGWQTGEMLARLETIVIEHKPDCVLVYGDTNSTLAGAIVAVKLQIPVMHVEAGLRSYNRMMPEEHNRVLTDHCSDTLFCPTQTAVDNLKREGIIKRVHLVGDTMYDATLQFTEIAQQRSTILNDLKLETESYLLATLHRPANTDSSENLFNILSALADIGEPIVFPVHPRTRQKISALQESSDFAIPVSEHLKLIDPVGYLDMLILEKNAKMILTDSGGMQKEAYFFAVPCVTLRDETEWIETVDAGWNTLVGANRSQIVNAVKSPFRPQGVPPQLFGDGSAAHHIVRKF